MDTDSNSTRAIDHHTINTFLMAVVVLTLAFTTACSMSLVDNAPEILRYCRVAERSEPSGQPAGAGQNSAAPANDANTGCFTTGDESCSDDTVDQLDDGRQVNCDL